MKKRILFVLFMGVLSVGFPLLIIEIGLRIFFPIYYSSILEAFQYDATLGFQVKSGFYENVTDHLQELYANNLKTINFQDNFKGYDKIIFTLGDSYTQGTGNPMDTSYPFQLDLTINRDKEGIYHKRYAVVNLALSAFGAKQSLLAMKRYMELVGIPVIVLYLGCDNDAQDDALFDSGYKHRCFVDDSPYWGWMVKPMQWLDWFQIVRFTKYHVMRLVSKKVMHKNKDSLASTMSVAQLQWPAIKKINDECNSIGAKLVVSWVYGDAYTRLTKKDKEDGNSYNWLKQKAKEEGIAFADWYLPVSIMQKTFKELPLLNKHSGGHYRPWVMRVMADEFAKHVPPLQDV